MRCIEIFFYREVGTKALYEIVQETITLLGSILPIIAIAVSVNLFLAAEGIPNLIANWFAGNLGSVIIFLLCLNVMLLAVGMVMDTFSAILILGPMMIPWHKPMVLTLSI